MESWHTDKGSFFWTIGVNLLPIPKITLSPPLHVHLNAEWNTLLDRKQWYFKFQSIWDKSIQPKKSCLLWLIYHRGIWTILMATKQGKVMACAKGAGQKLIALNISFLGVNLIKLSFLFLTNWQPIFTLYSPYKEPSFKQVVPPGMQLCLTLTLLY